TTFSTASVETVRLVAERRWGAGIASGAGMLLLAVAAGLLGLTIGTS
ncbi:chromosome condensation protein CrcB, partial [Frigoribacterium sp. CFBP 13712]|nr:chromosome condensation protein CrcB [Frigoribacterium sp. CFBP 13712]